MLITFLNILCQVSLACPTSDISLIMIKGKTNEGARTWSRNGHNIPVFGEHDACRMWVSSSASTYLHGLCYVCWLPESLNTALPTQQ